MLRDLDDEGTVEKRRKKLHHAGTLPSVVLSDITERDRDGELIAVPTEWDTEEHGEAPRIRVSCSAQGALERNPRRRRPRAAAHRGDRRGRPDPPYRPRHQDPGSLAAAPAWRVPPAAEWRRTAGADRQEAAWPRADDPARCDADAKDGDLVAVELTRHGRLGLQTAQVKERLGSLKSERAASFIAIHAHEIPHVFRREALAEAEAARPAGLEHREDWRQVPLVTIDPIDAKDHDDAVYAEADTDPGNPGGFVVTVAIADVAHYVTPASALDREALVRGNSVYFPDQVVPMLPERISNDSVLAAAQ